MVSTTKEQNGSTPRLPSSRVRTRAALQLAMQPADQRPALFRTRRPSNRLVPVGESPLLTCPPGLRCPSSQPPRRSLRIGQSVRPPKHKGDKGGLRISERFLAFGPAVGLALAAKGLRARRAALQVGSIFFPQRAGSALADLSIIGMPVVGKNRNESRGAQGEGLKVCGRDPQCRHGVVVWTPWRLFFR